MAIVQGNVRVPWVSNSPGGHRVCYRIGNSGPYTCVESSCGEAGESCFVLIPVGIDTESCEDLILEGYVSPLCADEDDIAMRNNFSINLSDVVTSSCSSWVVSCDSGSIMSILFPTEGNYEPNLTDLPVVISGGGGSGATAVASTDGDGRLSSVNITNQGSGYSYPVIATAPSYMNAEGDLVTPQGVVTLTPCSEMTYNNCGDDLELTIIEPVNVGDSVTVCSPMAPNVMGNPASIVNNSEACACSCALYRITFTDFGAVKYFNCETGRMDSIDVTDETEINLCTVLSSLRYITDYHNAQMYVTEIGPCPS